MIFSRRHFVAGASSLVLASNGIVPSLAGQKEKKNLIIVMMRGGMDGLTAIPYIGDSTLSDERPSINVTKSTKITSDFAIHPKLKNFREQWDSGQATVLHATSIPYTGRSHFEGQNLMESGGLQPYSDFTGWLGRGMEASNQRALSISLPMPQLLRGNRDNDNFFPSSRPLPSTVIIDALQENYNGSELLQTAIDRVQKRPLSMSLGGSGTEDVVSLARIAAKQMVYADGPSVAVFDLGGFDTHSFQGGDSGQHANELAKYDKTIGTLKKYLGDEYDNTLVATLTEFGRTIAQNGGSGTEHGYGTALLMTGGLLQKSQVIGDWPGLKKSQRFEGRDLNATIDTRAAYASVMGYIFDRDHKFMCEKAFYGAVMPDMTKEIFG